MWRSAVPTHARREKPAARAFRSGPRIPWWIPWRPDADAPILQWTVRRRTASLTSPANVRQAEFRSQAVRPVAAMIQNAAALCAAERILWLYLRLGQEPEKSFRDIIIRKKVTVQPGLRICCADRVKTQCLWASSPSRSDFQWLDAVTVRLAELLRKKNKKGYWQ